MTIEEEDDDDRGGEKECRVDLAISGLIDGERRLFDRIAPKRWRDFRGWMVQTAEESFFYEGRNCDFLLKLINRHK